jgi:hypothetical protein
VRAEPSAIGDMAIESKLCLYERAVSSRNNAGRDCDSLIPDIDQAVLSDIKRQYSEKCTDCICYALNPKERRVIFLDDFSEMKDYCVLAKLNEMTEEEALEYDCYDPLPEYRKDFNRLNIHWVGREQRFMRENFIGEHGREPTEKELEIALADEIGRPGKSHSERFRVYYALTFPDRVRKVKQIIKTEKGLKLVAA